MLDKYLLNQVKIIIIKIIKTTTKSYYNYKYFKSKNIVTD